MRCGVNGLTNLLLNYDNFDLSWQWWRWQYRWRIRQHEWMIMTTMMSGTEMMLLKNTWCCNYDAVDVDVDDEVIMIKETVALAITISHFSPLFLALKYFKSTSYSLACSLYLGCMVSLSKGSIRLNLVTLKQTRIIIEENKFARHCKGT